MGKFYIEEAACFQMIDKQKIVHIAVCQATKLPFFIILKVSNQSAINLEAAS